MPKVSVLMPLFNGRRFIEESLESVQKQTFTDWEFIIVNDYGSNDGSAEIVRQYAEKDNRIILVQTEERLGIAASLNLGLDMAKGEYIIRVDVDDPSEPERFKKQVAFMDAHPDISLCSCFCTSLSKQGCHIEKVAFHPEELKAAMLFPNEIRHFGVIMRKNFFRNHILRYDPDYIVEDYELWTRALMKGVVLANIPESLVTHRWDFGNISIAKGSKLEEEARTISARILKSIGVHTEEYFPELLSGWRAHPKKFAQADISLFLQQGYCLINEIYERNKLAGYCDPQALHKILFYRWNWIRQSCGLEFTNYRYEQFQDIKVTPVVSVVLPTFCSVNDISKAIDCVQAQTYTDWELLVINDADSEDGTAEIVKMYGWNDPRIRLIQAESHLGLAESLNLGIREAHGKYIARLDADDTSKPERFAKQIKFLESHPEIGICGTWQHHYGENIDWVHQTATDPKVLKCRLLFWCDLCHSTLMMRRDVFINNQLFYNPAAYAEDFDLWARAMQFTGLANIPEILGEYQEGTGITTDKIQLLNSESGQITARTVKHILNIDLPIYDCFLLNGWINPISKLENRKEELERLKSILMMIWEKNQDIKFFDQQALLQVLAAKWHWAKDDIDWRSITYQGIKNIEDIFNDKYKPSLWIRYQLFKQNNPKASVRAKKIIKRFILHPPAVFVRRIVKNLFRDCIEELNRHTEEWTWDRFERAQNELVPNLNISIEKWTWERYKRIEKSQRQIKELLLTEQCSTGYKIPYGGEKIRMLFLFQMGSFWPSWESFYNSCIYDDRLEVVFALLDEEYGDTDQMHTNKDFLDQKNIPYVIYNDALLWQMQPHVLVLQTPYDQYHRAPHVCSSVLKKIGTRIVYITYGIEITDTDEDHRVQFMGDAIINSWRIYTYSKRMQLDYFIYSPNGNAVRCFGHPKFDGLYNAKQFLLPSNIEKQIKGRKIVLWHVHFPKFVYQENGKKDFATPYLEEYEEFAKHIKNIQDFFFIFLPHPKFLYERSLKLHTQKILKLLSETENVFIDLADDYRPSLVNADFIITDRSALMVESGSVGVPVLYMYNPDYKEPIAKAIEPLTDSYYQGTGCTDMIHFLNMCRKGEDPLKEDRKIAFTECIPYFDGKCGERIKEDIIESLNEERNCNIQERLMQQSARLEKLEQMMHLYMEQEHNEKQEKAKI